MRVTPIQRSVFSNRRRSQTWSGNPSDSHDSARLKSKRPV